jgi:hypothetical protein
LFGLAPGAAVAADPVWTVTPTVVSQYLFRGQRLSGPAWQPSAELGWDRWTAGLWSSVPLDAAVPGLSDPEIDGYVSYTLPLGAAVSLVPGATLYGYPRAERAAGAYRWTFEPSLAANVTWAGVRVTPKLAYDTRLRGTTGELAAVYAWPLQRLGTELLFAASWGAYAISDASDGAGPAVRQRGAYATAGLTVPYQISVHGRVFVGWAYHRGYDSETRTGAGPWTQNPAAAARGVVTLGYTLTY